MRPALPFFSFLTPLSLLCLVSGCSADDGTNAATGGTGSGGDVGSGGLVSGAGGTGGSAAASGGSSSSSGGASSTGGGSAGGTGGVVESCTPSSGTSDVGASSFLDKATCLTWQKTNTFSGAVVNRVGAAHCEDLVQDGFDDWRLPSAQELRTYPGLTDSGNAYLAGPIYIPTSSPSDMEGCTGNSHSCNLTQYSPGNFGCAWQGPGGNAYGVLCVRGAAQVTLDASFAVATCCSGSSTFKVTDCTAYP